ncbi:MAG: Holliday junction branch migration protein RuvA [Oscillospiraceae bacterium]|jgi:Holliday junction DNA helicase RuvA|nr:Holliday junction branch migration protein RuvA [Oscillospiraceae bacterium]
MFYSLTGKVAHVEENMLAVDCHGVAYACAATAGTLREVLAGAQVTLFTYLNVREDALELFGFLTKGELACFRRLIAVTGVGPKAALAVLSAFSPEQLAFCVAAGDVKSLTRAQGVGKKIAERICLELKDKLQAYGGNRGMAGSREAGNPVVGGSEALEALLALGYDQGEALRVLRDLDEGLPTQTKVKAALKLLAG